LYNTQRLELGTLFDEINRKYEKAFRLETAEFEVTHRCLCSCLHCFLVKTPRDELSTQEIDDLFVQLRKEGVIELAITGGEPYLRDDLPRILELAHRERFWTNLLTTGILLGPPEIRHLQRTKVKRVEMSLLGSDAGTHDTIMGYPGAFARMMNAVSLLKQADIEVGLKITVLKNNYDQLPAMQELCNQLNVRLGANMMIAPQIDGNPAPQQHMIEPFEAAEVNRVFSGAGLEDGDKGGSGAVLTCRAGKTFCGISPEGNIMPCILFRLVVGNIRKRSLQDIWHDDVHPTLSRLRQLRDEDVQECFSCTWKPSCRRCPGIVYAETGRLGTASPSACLLAGRFK
jgi:radical SAM protein with 4Fe4S-binding SPASM domain